MQRRAVAAVLAGLSLSTAPMMVMPLLQMLHMQRLALSMASSAALYGFHLGALAVSVLPMVALGARLGTARLFIGCAAGLALSISLFGLPLGYVALLGLRVLQGVLAAGLMVSSYVLLRQLFGEARLALALACAVVAVTFGYALLPLLGGFGLAFIGGLGAVLPVLLLAALVLGLAWGALPQRDAAPDPFDGLGCLLAVLCLGLLLGAMGFSPLRPLLALLLLLLSLLCLGLWLWQQSRRTRPMLPLDLLARPTIAWAFPAGLFCAMATAGAHHILMRDMPDSIRDDPARISTTLMVGALLGAVLAIGLGWRFGHMAWRCAAAVGAGIVACGLAAAALNSSEVTWIAAVQATALGRAIFDVGNGMHVLAAAPRERALAAAGLLALAGTLGQLLGPYATTVLPSILFGLDISTDAVPAWLGLLAAAALLASLFSLAAGRRAPADAR